MRPDQPVLVVLVVLVALVASGLFACGERPPATRVSDSVDLTPRLPAPTDDALPCNTDMDCPVLACGPCTPGTAITHQLVTGPGCAENPCKDPAAICREHRCVVHSDTAEDPPPAPSP
jgi:hypothetical protein